MAWAKLHTDILGDPKLMRAARKGAKGLEFLPWIIAFAKEADDDGRLSVGGEPAEPQDIAQLVPGSSFRTIKNCLNSLEKIGVLCRDSSEYLRFSAWEARSGTKPSDSPTAIAERVARHRAAKSLSDKKESNASNALQGVSGNATEKRREEKEEEKRRELPSPPPPAAAVVVKPVRASASWMTPYSDAWKAEYGGDMPAGPAIQPLSKLRGQHGDPEALRRWRIYLAATGGSYASAAKFAATWGEWGEPPKQLANGRAPGRAEQNTANLQQWLHDAETPHGQ